MEALELCKKITMIVILKNKHFRGWLGFDAGSIPACPPFQSITTHRNASKAQLS
jgi:hypothetical protein